MEWVESCGNGPLIVQRHNNCKANARCYAIATDHAMKRLLLFFRSLLLFHIATPHPKGLFTSQSMMKKRLFLVTILSLVTALLS